MVKGLPPSAPHGMLMSQAEAICATPSRDERHRWLRAHVVAALAALSKGLPRG